MDVPVDPWTAEDAAFWTGTARYQPWKDVAAFFRELPVCVTHPPAPWGPEPDE